MNRALLFLVVVLCLSGTASAADYYVSTTGNDSLDGLSIENAWLNITVSDNKLYAGDTLYVVNGTYYGQSIEFAREGNSTHPIKIVAYNGTPLLNGLNVAPRGIGAYMNVDWSVIDGLTFTRYNYGAYSGYAGQRNNQTIINSTFYNMTIDGIKLYKDVNNILIENCTVYDVGDHGIHVYNQQSEPTTIAIGVRILNNTISNAPHNLIDFHTRVSNSTVDGNELYFSDDYDGVKQVGLYLHNGDTDNIIIRNNIFRDQTRPLEILNSKNITVINNTFENINGRSIMLGDAGTTYESTDFGVFDSIFENNTFNNTAGILFYTGSSATFENLTFKNNQFTNISIYFMWFDNNITLSNIEFLDTLPLINTNQGTRFFDYNADSIFQNVYYNYSSNIIFNTDDSTQTVYSSSKSSILINLTADMNLLSYNMSITPSENYVTTTNNSTFIIIDYISQVISQINFTIGSDVSNKNVKLNNVTATYNYSLYYSNATLINSKIASSSVSFDSLSSGQYYITETNNIIPTVPLVVGLLVTCHSDGTYTYPTREKQFGDIASNIQVSW